MRVLVTAAAVLLTACVAAGWEAYFDDPQLAELCKAARTGDSARIERLIQDGVDVNGTGEEGITALFCALKYGQPEIFAQLLQAGANPDQCMIEDATVLELSAEEPDSTYLLACLDAGGNPHGGCGGDGPLHHANHSLVWANHRILLDRGVDINGDEDATWTPVTYAATWNRWELVYRYLEEGVDYRLDSTILDQMRKFRIHPDNDDWTWRTKVAEWLTERGETVELWYPTEDTRGMRPLTEEEFAEIEPYVRSGS